MFIARPRFLNGYLFKNKRTNCIIIANKARWNGVGDFRVDQFIHCGWRNRSEDCRCTSNVVWRCLASNLHSHLLCVAVTLVRVYCKDRVKGEALNCVRVAQEQLIFPRQSIQNCLCSCKLGRRSSHGRSSPWRGGEIFSHFALYWRKQYFGDLDHDGWSISGYFYSSSKGTVNSSWQIWNTCAVARNRVVDNEFKCIKWSDIPPSRTNGITLLANTISMLHF